MKKKMVKLFSSNRVSLQVLFKIIRKGAHLEEFARREEKTETLHFSNDHPFPDPKKIDGDGVWKTSFQ